MSCVRCCRELVRGKVEQIKCLNHDEKDYCIQGLFC